MPVRMCFRFDCLPNSSRRWRDRWDRSRGCSVWQPQAGSLQLKKSGETRTHRIVFGAAVESRLRVRAGAGNHSGVDKYADGDRHLARVDQVVEDNRRLEGPTFIHECAAVLKNHRAGRLIRLVLRGNVDPIITHRIGGRSCWSTHAWRPSLAARLDTAAT